MKLKVDTKVKNALQVISQNVAMFAVAETWHFTRVRLDAAIADLNEAQMHWRMYEAGHTVIEYLFHIAGVEHYWAARLNGRDPGATVFDAQLESCVRPGFLSDDVIAIAPDFNSGEAARKALAYAYEELRPTFDYPTDQQLEGRFVSPIGDPVSGREGLVRVAQHAGYHTGQIWVMRMHPDFPA